MQSSKIEKVNFTREITTTTFTEWAWDGQIHAGTVYAENYLAGQYGISTTLRLLQVQPKYRRLGIAKVFVQDAINWSLSSGAKSIGGMIEEGKLLDDTVQHVAKYLQTLGFTINENDFWLKF